MRRTLRKVRPSPTPTRVRPASAVATLVPHPNSASPAARNTSAAVSMRRGPKRSAMAPVGICNPAYTASWAATKVARTEGPVWKRLSASSDATPRLVRWKTATKYALTASPQAAHAPRARPGGVPGPDGPLHSAPVSVPSAWAPVSVPSAWAPASVPTWVSPSAWAWVSDAWGGDGPGPLDTVGDTSGPGGTVTIASSGPASPDCDRRARRAPTVIARDRIGASAPAGLR